MNKLLGAAVLLLCFLTYSVDAGGSVWRGLNLKQGGAPQVE